MNKRIKNKWIKELRSGEWEQGQARLMDDQDRACCLGVLCDIAVREGVIDPWAQDSLGNWFVANGEKNYLPDAVQVWAGFWQRGVLANGMDLARLNDNGNSFNEIADLIEKHL